ncbi:MAG: hypothetical protein IKT46_03620 [Clostridia bacterium]|nr:hypothetical protein [Clostridia bacterium]
MYIPLDVTLDVPIELGNEFQDAMGYVDWRFKVEELTVESSDPKPPQTGDNMIIFIIIMAISAVTFTIISIPLLKKKKAE